MQAALATPLSLIELREPLHGDLRTFRAVNIFQFPRHRLALSTRRSSDCSASSAR